MLGHYHRMSPTREVRILLASSLAIGIVLGGASLLRVQVHRSLAPGDLAFFTQSAWNAAHGRGFAQTALGFEGSSLWSSVHWSPVRLLHIPFVLLGAPGLVLLQALLVLLGALVLGRSARGQGALGPLLLLSLVLHPLSFALATADARPIVFFLPLVALAIGAIERGRHALLVGAVLGMGLVREEAPFVILALLPWALGRGPRPVVILLGGAALAAALVGAWGGAGLQTHPDALAHLSQVLEGRASLLRDPHEAAFAGLSLALLPSALLAPRLLLPGLLGWVWLLIFSTREPAHAEGAGVHYLAVVWPFVASAAAVGARRAWASARLRLPLGLTLLAGLLVGLGGAVQRAASWSAEREEAGSRRALIEAIAAHPGGALVPDWAAPALARREGLWMIGHLDSSEEAMRRVGRRLDHAVLPDEGEEAQRWAEVLRAEGLRPVQRAGAEVRWGR